MGLQSFGVWFGIFKFQFGLGLKVSSLVWDCIVLVWFGIYRNGLMSELCFGNEILSMTLVGLVWDCPSYFGILRNGLELSVFVWDYQGRFGVLRVI